MVAFDKTAATEEVLRMSNRDQVWRALIETYDVDDDDDNPEEGLSNKSTRGELNRALIDRMEELHNREQDDVEEDDEEDDLETDAYGDWTTEDHLRCQTRILRAWQHSKPCEFWNFGNTRKECGVCKQDNALQPFHDTVPRVSMKCVVHEVYVCGNLACLNAHLATRCGYTCANDNNEKLESTAECPKQGETTEKTNKAHGRGAAAQKRDRDE